MKLSTKARALHRGLENAQIPHAFGGALALGWCTGMARGTRDIDINVFVSTDRAAEVVAALPSAVKWSEDDLRVLQHDGQVRLSWGDTPVDLFLDTTPFHEQLELRTHVELLAGEEMRFLGCTDLAVFKVFFDRPRDWGDLHEMALAGTIDRERVLGVLVEYLGADDERVARVRALPDPDQVK